MVTYELMQLLKSKQFSIVYSIRLLDTASIRHVKFPALGM